MAYQAFARVYDRLMRGMPYEDWIRFAVSFWERHGFRPHTVADLGCGTGNIAIPLASRGYRVTGIDLSDDMLAAAQAKAQTLSAADGGVRWIQQDMREWELDAPVDAVVSFCDSLNYLLEPEDVRGTFVRTYDGLDRGGWFVFDLHSPDTLRRYAEEQPFVLQEPDIAYAWTCEWEEERLEISHALSIFALAEDGRYERIEEWHVQRAYELQWVTDTLRQVGFVDVECFADFAFDAPRPDSVRWFVGARKPA